jgi:hypothetical protein
MAICQEQYNDMMIFWIKKWYLGLNRAETARKIQEITDQGSECGNGGSGLAVAVPGQQGEFIPESPALKHIQNDLDPGVIHQVGGGPDVQRIAPGHHQAFLHEGKPHDQGTTGPGHFPAGKGHIGFLSRLVVQVQVGQVGFAPGQAAMAAWVEPNRQNARSLGKVNRPSNGVVNMVVRIQ